MKRSGLTSVLDPSHCFGSCLTNEEAGADVSRRDFLAHTLVGAGAVLAGAALSYAPPAMGQSTMTPDAAGDIPTAGLFQPAINPTNCRTMISGPGVVSASARPSTA